MEGFMPIEVFDYRKDIRNLWITPQIRSRFMRLEPGVISYGHTHDLGHEIFLILQGQAEFTIEGETAILGPGQVCFARAHEWHEVRALGDEPMIMYLSVTPHIEPTHTMWEGHERKLPPRYGGSTRLEREAAGRPLVPAEEITARFLDATRALADTGHANVAAQEDAAARLVAAEAAGDAVGAKAAVDAMWGQLYEMYQRLYALEEVWNELAPRVAEP
jgi:quercetin dioxygenase-like cupin family protein